MAQAIAHVLIHEWSHIVTQSSAHSSRGITQAYLSVNDLIAEPKITICPLPTTSYRIAAAYHGLTGLGKVAIGIEIRPLSG